MSKQLTLKKYVSKKRKKTQVSQQSQKKLKSKLADTRSLARTVGFSQALVKAPVGLPDTIKATLTYTGSYVVTTGAPGFVDTTYVGNGMFQPKVSGATTQPMGFDQWAALFKSYHVNASSIEVLLWNDTAALQEFVVVPQAYSTAITSIQIAREQPKAKWEICGTISDLGDRRKTISHYCSTKDILGRNDIGTQSSALASANPSDSWYWHICNQPYTSITNDAIVFVRIRYYCTFFERAALPLS